MSIICVVSDYGDASTYIYIYIYIYIYTTVKYADDLVLMAKEETVLQDMIDKLIETGMAWK